MKSLNLEQDERISYKMGKFEGTGKVVGVATNGDQILGQSYIIEPDVVVTSEKYKFTHFCMYECYMKRI